MFGIDLVFFASLVNQSLSATIAIIAGAFFLYSLATNIRNRVAWAFSAMLLFVTITYLGDLGVSYSTQLSDAEVWLRFQWAGIAFVPATYVHLSHTLLELTGLHSRGRRRRSATITYMLAFLFFVLGVTTDVMVAGVVAEPAPHLQAGPVFWLFVLYFASAVLTSLSFVIRARRRNLTSSSRRRMTLLLLPYAAPALAVFPFLVVGSPILLNRPLVFNLVLAVVDIALVFMIISMAYTLAFFVSLQPDRLVKAQMLQFLLRGPLVATVALAVIIWVPRAGRFLGLPGEEVMPFIAVAVILLLQWGITVIRPPLERLLIFTGDEADVQRIRDLERRLLTATDYKQVLESILAVLCDYLRVESAFIVSLGDEGSHLEFAIGLQDEKSDKVISSAELALAANGESGALPALAEKDGNFRWEEFWITPLRYVDHNLPDGNGMLVGALGVAIYGDEPIEHDKIDTFNLLIERAAQVLGDWRIQRGVFGAVESLLPRIEAVQRLHEKTRFGDVEALTQPSDVVLHNPAFFQFVKDALSHYWGGPKLTQNSLMNLAVVRQALAENEGNPQRALRAVLLQAIESLKPSGKRSMTTTEWIMYNILEMRFVQGRKVRDVAMRLAMSESDLYRKQRLAIEAVGSMIAGMERASNSHVEDPDVDKPSLGS